MLNWMLTSNVAGNMIETPQFKQFMSLASGWFKIPSRRTLMRTHLPALYLERCNELKQMLAQANTVHITIDGWTARNQTAFLAITAHWVTAQFELKERLLDMQRFEGRHTAQHHRTKATAMLNQWGLTLKVNGLTTFDVDLAMDPNQARPECLEPTIRPAAVLPAAYETVDEFWADASNSDEDLDVDVVDPGTVQPLTQQLPTQDQAALVVEELDLVALADDLAEQMGTSDEASQEDLATYVEFVTSDNVQTLQNALSDMNLTRVPCLAHVLHLCVLDVRRVPAVRKMLGRVRKIVEHFMKSEQASMQLLAEQEKTRSAREPRWQPVKLIMENDTRWTSTHAMLTRFLRVYKEVMDVLSSRAEVDPHVGRLILSRNKEIRWKKLMTMIAAFFEPIAKVQTLSQQAGIPSVAQMAPTIFATSYNSDHEANLCPSNVEDTPVMEAVRLAFREKFNKYFADHSEAQDMVAMCAYVDPRRWHFEFIPAIDRPRYRHLVKSMIEEALRADQPTRAEQPQAGMAVADKLGFLEEATADQPDTATYDAEQIMTKYQNAARAWGRTAIEGETDYAKQVEKFESLRALDFWQQFGHQFSVLGDIARRYLPVTVTGAASERVFSKAGLIQSRFRARQSPENVRALVFLGYNLAQEEREKVPSTSLADKGKRRRVAPIPPQGEVIDVNADEPSTSRPRRQAQLSAIRGRGVLPATQAEGESSQAPRRQMVQTQIVSPGVLALPDSQALPSVAGSAPHTVGIQHAEFSAQRDQSRGGMTMKTVALQGRATTIQSDDTQEGSASDTD